MKKLHYFYELPILWIIVIVVRDFLMPDYETGAAQEAAGKAIVLWLAAATVLYLGVRPLFGRRKNQEK